MQNRPFYSVNKVMCSFDISYLLLVRPVKTIDICAMHWFVVFVARTPQFRSLHRVYWNCSQISVDDLKYRQTDWVIMLNPLVFEITDIYVLFYLLCCYRYFNIFFFCIFDREKQSEEFFRAWKWTTSSSRIQSWKYAVLHFFYVLVHKLDAGFLTSVYREPISLDYTHARILFVPNDRTRIWLRFWLIGF